MGNFQFYVPFLFQNKNKPKHFHVPPLANVKDVFNLLPTYFNVFNVSFYFCFMPNTLQKWIEVCCVNLQIFYMTNCN